MAEDRPSQPQDDDDGEEDRISKLPDFLLVEILSNWIHYAINCNVEELDLALWGFQSEVMFPLDQLFFVNSCFTDLRLALCMFNPTGAIAWKNLKSLFISYGKLDEATIENILSGSPVLETLELEGCYGYMRINITSKSVKKLVFIVYMNRHRPENDIIEINAPNILSLTVRRHMWLGKILLLNVSSLVEAELDYPNLSPSLPYLGNRREAEEEMLKAFILKLVHVKDLRIGAYCFNAKLFLFWFLIV
ncbi:putative F-box/LRR-repeat protein At3g28410 [Bidens hawaiensis]|uniref:putative F-box/LRR-repeat protein At3g28410 n=1 Tax=Bidens hawaiensis TaxID=980011 RepID=UPI00404B079F